MQNIPKDIAGEILKNLSGKEILASCSTSKQFGQVCSDDPKYQRLWRQKIEDEFKEVYTGEFPFQQYKYLVKLHNQKLYAVYFWTDVEQKRLAGVYDLYGKAVMSAMETLKQHLEEDGKTVNPEALRYLLWNKKKASLDGVYYVEIEQFNVRKDFDVFDERKFFAEREKLFVDLFGRSSGGYSQTVINPFNLIPFFYRTFKRFAARKRGEKYVDNRSFEEKFYSSLEKTFDAFNNGNGVTAESIDANTDLVEGVYVEKELDVKFTDAQKKVFRRYMQENLPIVYDLEEDSE